MKKLYILLGAAGLLFTGCDPNEGLYEEIAAHNANNKKDIVGTVELTLAPEDYALLDKQLYNDVRTKNMFFSEGQAIELVPSILQKKYPRLDSLSLATVTYGVYTAQYDLANALRSPQKTYTVTTADYDSQGGSVEQYDNFSSEAQILSFLDYKYPSQVRDTIITLKYDYFQNGSKTAVEDKFVFSENVWIKPVSFDLNDYKAMLENPSQRFPNFTNDEADARHRIAVYLAHLFPYAKAADEKRVVYSLYNSTNRTTTDIQHYFTYDGMSWNLVAAVENFTRQFTHNGTKWETDNTIALVLATADYTAIANNYKGTAHGDNLARYGNFNLNDGYWTDALILEAISNYLKTINPTAKQDQKYRITYKTFKSGAGTADVTLGLILKNGVYVKQ